MREKDYVVIIGSANIDVAGYSHESLNYADSNPGKIKFTPGGVGRNIAQNLALLGNKARLRNLRRFPLITSLSPKHRQKALLKPLRQGQ